MYGLNIEKIHLDDEREKNEVAEFLNRFELRYDDDIDYTLVARQDGKILATASKAKNIIKAFAVDDALRGEGISTSLVTSITDKMFEQGIYHSFIFTKPKNITIFSSLNYKLIYETSKSALLENGLYNINSSLDKIIKENSIDISKTRGALVMNCNPFTKGHQFLVEKAASECEEVIVFVVEEDKSLFPFKDRFELVKQGTKYLGNVKVVKGGEYIISQATFPSYFLRQEDDKLKVYTEMDAGIFGKYFCPKFNIKTRYVGEEPYCAVTNAYNDTLVEELQKFGVEVSIVKRKTYDESAISASRVRELIKEGQMEKVKELVPETTWEFLNTKAGREIAENIKKSNSPH